MSLVKTSTRPRDLGIMSHRRRDSMYMYILGRTSCFSFHISRSPSIYPNPASAIPHIRIAIQNKMGHKPNRKRTRHRPLRTRRASDLLPSPLQPTSQPTPPTRSIRWLYPSVSSCAETSTVADWPSTCTGTPVAIDWRDCRESGEARESIGARDRRIFGDADQQGDEVDLRGPMLDVVLSLFDGLDYDEV